MRSKEFLLRERWERGKEEKKKGFKDGKVPRAKQERTKEEEKTVMRNTRLRLDDNRNVAGEEKEK